MEIVVYLMILLPVVLTLSGTSMSFFGSPYSAFASPNVPSIPAFSNVSGNYVLSDIGFRITFPLGWSGIDLGTAVLVAPTGINPKTGVLNPSNNLEKVYLILARSNTSDIVGNPEDLNLSDYHKYVNDSAKRIGCKVLSDEFVKLNGINSERVTGKCGPIEEMTMLTYAIASGKNVIFVGLKGLTSAFDYNHEDFMRSLKTIKVDDQSDIEALIFDRTLQSKSLID
jgi:hypothetical protein